MQTFFGRNLSNLYKYRSDVFDMYIDNIRIVYCLLDHLEIKSEYLFICYLMPENYK